MNQINIIDKLQPFMAHSSPPAEEHQPPRIAPSKEPRPQQQPRLQPQPPKPQQQQQSQDSLYTCFKILRDGLPKYLAWKKSLPANQPMDFYERQEKMEFIDKFRNPALKSTYFKGPNKLTTLANVEADLSVNKCISLPTFIYLCRMATIPAFSIIYYNCYYDIQGGDLEDEGEDNVTLTQQYFNGAKEKQHIVYDKQTKKWNCKMWSNSDLSAFKNASTTYQIVNIMKPIKAVSSYKLNELKTLCDCLLQPQAAATETMTKPLLYGALQQYFQTYYSFLPAVTP